MWVGKSANRIPRHFIVDYEWRIKRIERGDAPTGTLSKSSLFSMKSVHSICTALIFLVFVNSAPGKWQYRALNCVSYDQIECSVIKTKSSSISKEDIPRNGTATQHFSFVFSWYSVHRHDPGSDCGRTWLRTGQVLWSERVQDGEDTVSGQASRTLREATTVLKCYLKL